MVKHAACTSIINSCFLNEFTFMKFSRNHVTMTCFLNINFTDSNMEDM